MARDAARAWPRRAVGVLRRRYAAGTGAINRSLCASDGHACSKGTEQQAREWIGRQRGRLGEGVGFSFAIVDTQSERAVGHIGLWLAELQHGRARAGYSIAPKERGQGFAVAGLIALTHFAWTIPDLYRIELYIEPWNVGSKRTAEQAGYDREGLLRSHQEIGGSRRDMLLYACKRAGQDAQDRSTSAVHSPIVLERTQLGAASRSIVWPI
jgi:ribosomal-protein-alanine N-acetyltransferase